MVVNLRDHELVDNLGDLVFRIDRRTRWGNPYRMHSAKSRGDGTREEVIALYGHYLVDSDLVGDLEVLRGHALACWCAPAPCHGDVLVDALKSTATRGPDN